MPLALGLARMVRSHLYGVSPADPRTLVGGGVLHIALAALAALVPARRASRVDPITALRA